MEPHPRRNRHPSQRGRPLGRVRHQTLRRTHLHLHQGAPQTPTPPSGIANDCGRKWQARNLRVAPAEVEYVIQHNPYSRARALLWKCRGPAGHNACGIGGRLTPAGGGR